MGKAPGYPIFLRTLYNNDEAVPTQLQAFLVLFYPRESTFPSSSVTMAGLFLSHICTAQLGFHGVHPSVAEEFHIFD